MPTSTERLRAVARAACGDALFAVLGTGTRALEGVARRRAAAHDAIARGETTTATMSNFEPWLAAMSAAAAPIGTPWFVPMREAIDDGLTLEREARGLRAMLGASSPADRVRKIGAFAVRVVRAVSAADGDVSKDEQRAIDLLIAALGLPEEDVRVLSVEPIVPLSTIEVPEELEWNVARAIVQGAFHAASSDGLDPAEHEALLALAARMKVQNEVVDEARSLAERSLELQYQAGLAAVDSVRYVVAILPEPEVSALVVATVHLSVPSVRRAECLRTIGAPTATPLASDHRAIDKSARAAALSAAWAAALSIDPHHTTRARLMARHDRVATDLGSDRAGREAREDIERYLDEVLARGVAITGG